MALSPVKVFHTVVGDRYMHVYDVTGDASYASGGESLTKADLGFDSTTDPEFSVLVQPSAGYVAEYDIDDALLKVYWVDTSTDGAPMADASGANLSAVTFRVSAFGKFPL